MGSTRERSSPSARQGPLFDVTLHDRSSSRRDEIEEWIRRRFRETHGAEIQQFLTSLMVIENGSGEITAAAGFCAATGSPLFLEQYLGGARIEEELTRCIESSGSPEIASVLPVLPIDRTHIIEIGNLAASATVGLPLLFLSLDSLLCGLGFEWAVFTATRTVRALLRRAHFPFVELMAADGACLGARTVEWGSYYESDPRIAVVHRDFRAQQLDRPALPVRFEELIAACKTLGATGVDRAA